LASLGLSAPLAESSSGLGGADDNLGEGQRILPRRKNVPTAEKAGHFWHCSKLDLQLEL
jgi:hypothetical protein